MFIKNKTKTYQSFRLAKTPYRMAPGETIQIADEHSKDAIMGLLLGRGVVEVVKDKAAVKEIVKAEAEKAEKVEKKVEFVGNTEENRRKDVAKVVQCCAPKANGDRCTTKVKVNEGEFSADKPYFCGRHKNEDPAEYEKVDGVFVKVGKKAEAPAEVDEAEETVDNVETVEENTNAEIDE